MCVIISTLKKEGCMRRPTKLSSCRNACYDQAEAIEIQVMQERYREAKKTYNNSEIGLLEQAVRRMVQANSKAEAEAKKIIFNSAKTLREDIYSLILDLVAEDIRTVGYVSYEKLDYIFKKLDLAFQRLKINCSQEEYMELLKPGCYTDYEKLFTELIDQVDLRFAAYAPKRAVVRKNIKYKKLPDEDLIRIANHFNELQLFDDPTFKAEYAPIFREAFENVVEQ